MSRELDEHREFLQDRRRVEAFAAAIAAAVRPGDVVVDLGCGTGIFGLFACRAGAARVYAIDRSEMAEVARLLAADNGYADRVIVVRGDSRDVSLPERADVIVSDQIGHFGFEAGVLEYFHDARRRFLKPGGRLVPARVHLWLAAVEATDLRRGKTFWSSRPYGFDMAAAQTIAWNSGHPTTIDVRQLLSAGREAISLDTGADHAHFAFDVDLPIVRDGSLDGVIGWFSSNLGEAISITNAPGDPHRIDRRQALFFVPEARAVRRGEIAHVRMSIRPADLIVNWIVEHRGEPPADALLARYELSTFRGMPISADDVRRTAPAFVPTLTERGEARRLVIDLIDGHTAVADIEREVLRRFPTVVDGAADAARFVAEVVIRYAQ